MGQCFKKVAMISAAVSCCAALSACGSVNSFLAKKTETTEMYRVFDIKSDAGESVIADAAIEGLTASVPEAKSTHLIQTEIPEEPQKIKLINPFKNTNALTLKVLYGDKYVPHKTMDCEEAIYVLDGTKEVAGDSNVDIKVCIFRYKDGYRLNEYAVLTKESGGFIEQISRIGAHTMVGTPEEWTEKSMLDVVRNIKKRTDASVSFIQGWPEISGTPWLDTNSDIKID